MSSNVHKCVLRPNLKPAEAASAYLAFQRPIVFHRNHARSTEWHCPAESPIPHSAAGTGAAVGSRIIVTVKPSMNDIVFREIAWLRRRKAKMERSVEFNLRRLTVRRNEVRAFQKFNRFLQPRVAAKCIARHHHCHNLNGRPVHQFCQRRDHNW